MDLLYIEDIAIVIGYGIVMVPLLLLTGFIIVQATWRKVKAIRRSRNERKQFNSKQIEILLKTIRKVNKELNDRFYHGQVDPRHW